MEWRVEFTGVFSRIGETEEEVRENALGFLDKLVAGSDVRLTSLRLVCIPVAREWKCRYCKHLVDICPPRTRHFVGVCEFRLVPETCGKFVDVRDIGGV